MSKKIDRAVHGPSWVEVILGAVISAALGVVLGAVLMVIKPVVVAKEMPKEPVAGAVYYIEGSRDGAKAKQALAKRKAFAAGQSVTVTEEEINSLIVPAAPAAAPAPKPGEKPKPADKSKAGGKAAPAAASADILATGTPNFRIREGVIQVALPITLNVGFEQKVILQARGAFAKKGAGFALEPDTLLVGSCPVQRLPFLSEYVQKKFLAAQAIPEDIATSWAKLSGVAIEGNALKLAMP